MRTKVLIFLIALSATKIFACDCKNLGNLKVLQEIEFDNSECVFIGEVLEIDSDNNTFKVKVIESFKGNELGKTYNGIYDKFCGPIIDEKGKWLIYGNFNSKNQVEINYCGLTRSLSHPENNVSGSKPPEPLQPYKTESKSQSEKKRIEWILRAKSNLENEIIDLRHRTE